MEVQTLIAKGSLYFLLIKSYKGDLFEVVRYIHHQSLKMLSVYDDNMNIKAGLLLYYKIFEKSA